MRLIMWMNNMRRLHENDERIVFSLVMVLYFMVLAGKRP